MPYKLDFPTNGMQRLYEVEGLTVREIGERVGLSGQAVHIRLQKEGVEFRPQQVRPR